MAQFFKKLAKPPVSRGGGLIVMQIMNTLRCIEKALTSAEKYCAMLHIAVSNQVR